MSLFRRRIIETLSPAGIEALIAGASTLSEGQLTKDGHYYGSTMITIDLAKYAGRISDACDVATARRLANAMSEDQSALQRLSACGRTEALGIAGRPLEGLETEVRVRAEGPTLYIDIDVEGRVERGAIDGERSLSGNGRQR